MALAYTGRTRRRARKLFVGGSLILASGVPFGAHAADLQLVYLANFHGGSYLPSVNKLNLGPLEEASGSVPNTTSQWTPKNGAVELKVTKPDASPDPVSTGLFATRQVSFGPGSIIKLEATFIRPTGPHRAGTLWASTVSARTGGKDDLGTETRAAVTLQSRGNGCRLNIRGLVTPSPKDLEQSVCDSIFKDGQPFTLALLIDRVRGEATGSIKAGSYSFTSDPHALADFRKDGGPAITAVGPSLAINTGGAGDSASVEVREFRISAPKPTH